MKKNVELELRRGERPCAVTTLRIQIEVEENEEKNRFVIKNENTAVIAIFRHIKNYTVDPTCSEYSWFLRLFFNKNEELLTIRTTRMEKDWELQLSYIN